MPEPSKGPMEAAVNIMQDVFLWDDERCLSPEGRAGIGAVAEKLNAYAAERHAGWAYDKAIAERDTALAETASTADFLNTCLRESGLDRAQVEVPNLKPGIDALYLRNVALVERVWALETALKTIEAMGGDSGLAGVAANALAKAAAPTEDAHADER